MPRSTLLVVALALWLASANAQDQKNVQSKSAFAASQPNLIGNRQRYSNALTGPLALDRGPIYVNPNPSTRSLTAERKHSNPMSSLPVVPSSIGKGEQQQLSEWPFVRSLQMARQGHMMHQHPFQGMVDRLQQSASSPQPLDEARTTAATSEPDAPEVATTTMPSTIEDSTVLGSPEESITTQASSSKISDEDAKGSISSTVATVVEDNSETSVTPSSSSLVETSKAPASSSVNNSDTNLFARDFHSSIQKAVDRLIKMGADGFKNKTGSLVAYEAPKESSQRSSLSLNVLLKNFGVHNLTNMDQILLKSTLRNDSTSIHGRPIGSAGAEQRLEVKGARSVQSTMAEARGGENGNASEESDDQLAECKIEYTMKHVNISLMNGGHGDYTCDYVIDRKLAAANSQTQRQRQVNKWLDGGSANKVCKLQISSQFFANSSEIRESSCNGTYLSIASQNFCYRKFNELNQAQAHLSRVFDFPIELNAFDIKMVHKRVRGSQAADPSENEIHLEIKPLLDSNCLRENNMVASRANILQSVPPSSTTSTTTTTSTTSTSTTTSTTTTSTTRAPKLREPSPASTASPSAFNSSSLDSRDSRASNNVVTISMNPKQRFILKLPHDKQLHPLNNPRFKVSQTFDVTSTPKLFPQAQWQARSESPPKLCDNGLHSSTLGQLTSSDYPLYYRAGIDCSFIIHRTSARYCQLQLHFRDFDLLQAASASEDAETCLGDYLQIGQTRYCNKYAMIGHRMRLDFPANDAIELRFHTDHMQGGRGFLIKYQQIECSLTQSDQPIQSTTENSRLSTTMLGQQVISSARTIAPPQQQPDFALALKTTAEPAKAPSSSTKSPPRIDSSPKSTKDAKEARQVAQVEFKEKIHTIGRTSTTPKASTTNSSSSSTLMPMASTVSLNSAMFQTVERPNQDSGLTSARLSAPDCNQVHTSREFIISSPGYPSQYAENLQCLHYVRRNSSRICYLELTFIKFDLEPDTDCRFDYLEVNNVRLCGLLKDINGLKTTRIYLFEEPIKLLKFKTDSSNSRDGFLIRAEQLECAQDGSIQRLSGTTGDNQQVNVVIKESNYSRESNSSRTTIQYDSTPLTAAQASLGARSGSSRASNDQFDQNCDEIFVGSEVTIRSPHWPESYGDDVNLNTCRYTILRDTSSRNKICQIELRFVNLRLGVADCIDVNGFEVLCGFNTRNMVKHYPFERQSHITVTFLSGSAKSSRSMRSSSSLVDLLPGRQPMRFMIIAKQHECIDGFLAPRERTNSSSLIYSSPENSQARTANRPHPSQLDSATLIADKSPVIRYDFDGLKSQNMFNRSSPKSTLMYSMLGATTNNQAANQAPVNISNLNQQSAQRPVSLCLDGSVLRTSEQIYTANYPLSYQDNSHCRLPLGRQSANMCYLELEFVDMDLEANQSCQHNFLQVQTGINLVERFCNMAQIDKLLGSTQTIRIAFERELEYKISLLFHSARPKSGRGFLLLHRQIPCASSTSEKKGHVESRSKGDQKESASFSTPSAGHKCQAQFGQYNGIISTSSISARSRSATPQTDDNLCDLRIKLLPGFCQLQLNFGEFELGPRVGNRCALDWLEFAASGESTARRYCTSELKNSTVLLDQTDLSTRVVQLKYMASPSITQGFRAIFKQIECLPEPLPASLANAAGKSGGLIKSGRTESADLGQTDQPKVDFRELSVSGEYFELDSSKLSPPSKGADQYEPNLFVIYRIKRFAPEVCKVRLMFYRFDLEMSAGCKRDFLDVNNVDRLCGQLSRPDENRRDYSWPAKSSGDFLVSFVSDSAIQRRGFLIFGQQIRANCTSASQSSTSHPTFDEEPSHGTTAASVATTSSTSSTATTASSLNLDKPHQKEVSSSVAGAQVDNKATGNCYKLIDSDTFEIQSPNWPQRYAPGQTCYYLIHKSQADVCGLTLSVKSMVLGAEANMDCQPESMDHLDIDQGSQILCGLTTRTLNFEVEYKQKQFLTVKFNGTFGAGFGFLLEGTQNKCGSKLASETKHQMSSENGHELRLSQHDNADSSCNKLITEKVSLIESVRFPLAYEHNQDCIYIVRRLNQSICAIDLTLNHFDLEQGHLNESSPASNILNCDSDFMEIDYSRFCGLYPPKHKLRFNYFAAELDKLIRFHSDAAIARSGFSILVSQVSDCSPGEPGQGTDEHRTTAATPAAAAATTTTPSTSSDVSTHADEIISYLPDSSTSTNLSSKPATMSIQEEQGAIEPNTLCEFTYHSERQFLVSPGYNEKKFRYDNNLDCLYKIHAKGYQFCAVRLSLLDLDLEKSSECHNDYLLIDNQRYCGRMDNASRVEVAFPEALPRELHLRLHTNAHVNEGRGFRLLYEQLACLPATSGAPGALEQEDVELGSGGGANEPPSSGQYERQLRRSHLGQLSYPQNYVSEQSGQVTSSADAPDSGARGPKASKSAEHLWSRQVDHHRQLQLQHQQHQQQQQQQQLRAQPKRALNNEKLDDRASFIVADQDLFLRREITVAKPPVPHLESMRS